MDEVTLMPLTATPSSFGAQAQFGTLQAGTVIGPDYAIIASGDFSGLQQAISYSAGLGGQFYPIYLEAGYYDVTQTMVIYGNVALYGRGMDVTFIRQALPGGTGPGTMNGLFTLPGASLTLDNLTVMDGAMIAYSSTGGGVMVQGSNSVLTVTNSRFHHNTAGAAGGGIYMRPGNGRVVIENSYFTNNVMNAVRSDSSASSPPAVMASCTVFDANTGSAIINSNSTGRFTVTTSNLTNNTGGTSASVTKHIYSYTTSVATVDAQYNYWFNPTVPASANELGVNTSNQRSTPIDSTVCPQDPPVPIPSQQLTLDDFGITTVNDTANWTMDELQAILDSVTKIGEAFAIQVGGSVDPVEIFREVMGVTTQGNITLKRVNNRPNCIVDNATRTIECGNLLDANGNPRTFTQFVITHEFGHIFDNQTAIGGNKPLRDYINDTRLNTPDIINDVRGPVMGNFINANGQTVWRRGERGWGSGPGSTYSPNDDVNGDPQQRVFTDFQQNPAPYQDDPPRTATQVANEETAADMFLNWVYRTVAGNQGFLNRTWKPTDLDPASSTACNVAAGCAETYPEQPGVSLRGNSGDARFSWMNTRMLAIFTAHGWQ